MNLPQVIAFAATGVAIVTLIATGNIEAGCILAFLTLFVSTWI